MRILSLKCANLNSLRGEQPEIRFDTGPLAEAGLFAITGPTGTGKTTLLDAITLALYGKVYRFEDEGAALKSDEILEQLMTVGTSSTVVEVTFEADGQAYHSRWACNRARNKIGGKIQPAEMQLSRIHPDGSIESPYKTRTEVPKEITRLTHLDFGQFVRSVLLPQGAFAQFLKAKKGVRAELLQKLTNTSHFAVLGVAAYQRWQAADEALKAAEIETKFYKDQVLTEADMAALEAAEATIVSELASVDQQLAALQPALKWFETDRLALASLETTAAESAESQAAATTPETDALRAALARHQQVEPCREAWEAWQRAKEAQETAEKNHAKLVAQSEPLKTAVADAKIPVDTAQTTWQMAKEAHETQAPGLRQAELFDQEYASASARVSEQQARVQAAETTYSEQVTQLEAEDKKLTEARRQYAAAKEWLTENLLGAQLMAEALAAPRQQWQQVELLKAQLTGLAKQDDEDAKKQLKLTTDREKNHQAQLDFQAQQETIQRSTEATEVAFAHFLAQLSGHGMWLKADYEAALETLGQLQQSHRRLEALNALPVYRETLVDGEPCPLCGARDHQLHTVLTASDAEVAASKKAFLAHEKATEKLKNRLEAVREVYVQAKAQWPTEQPLPAAEAASYFTAADESALLTKVADFRTQLTASADAQQAAKDQWLSLTNAVQTLQVQLQEVAERVQQRQLDRNPLNQQCADYEANIAAFFASLELPYSSQTVAADLEDLRRRGEAFQARQQDEKLALQTGTQAAELVKMLGLAVEKAQISVQEEQQKLREQTTAAADLLAQRHRLCPAGLQPSVELNRLAEAEKAALLALEKARSMLMAAEKAHSEHLIAVGIAAQSLEAATAARTEALAQWLAQRAAAHLPDEAEMTTWHIRDAAQLTVLRETLRGLDERRNSAEKAAQFAQNTLDQHRATTPPYATEVEVQALFASFTAERDRLLPAKGVCEAKRQQHIEAMAAAEKQLQALAVQQTETDRWLELRKLIGGAKTDNTKFSQFAQSLTLAHLVREANRHLFRLAPRYELLPKTDDDELGLWILDADNAGTQRAVESLSGGETFLVSLALALGLSDLAGYRVQIESLFIDEGFGTLDPETLDTAISALETVQQAGRMVGVISHVAALKERIKTQIQLRKVAGGSRLAVVTEA